MFSYFKPSETGPLFNAESKSILKTSASLSRQISTANGAIIIEKVVEYAAEAGKLGGNLIQPGIRLPPKLSPICHC